MTKFEDHLWREVAREHGDDLAQMSGPEPDRPQRPSTALIAGSAFGVVGMIAGLAFLLGGASTSPAFAVTRHHDGWVTVSITRVSGITGANARLRRLGIRAQVTRQIPAHCGDGPPPPVAAPPAGFTDAHWNWTIDPSKVPTGRTLALTPPPVPGGSNGNSAGSGTASGTATSTQTGTANRPESGTATSAGSDVPVPDANGGSGGRVWSCVVQEQNQRLPGPGNSDSSGTSGKG